MSIIVPQYYLTHMWGDKRVDAFPKGIIPKVNVVVLLKFELTNFEAALQYFNHYVTRSSPQK